MYFPYQKIITLFIVVLAFSIPSRAQKQKADSLKKVLMTQEADTNKVRLLWQLASAVKVYNTDSALLLGQEAYLLASSVDYVEGQSRSLGILANTFTLIGNYARALEFNIRKLKLEEQRDKPANLGSVLMNIGIVYVMQEEYRKAIEYYTKADSVIYSNNVESLKYNIALNMGDVYNRLDISDSAYMYFEKSLAFAKAQHDTDLIGTSMTGLGHSYRKMKNFPLALVNYRTGILYLEYANDYDILCEATLGLAELFEAMGKYDSAAHYGRLSASVAESAGFLSQQLNGCDFLKNHYKKIKNLDSAFLYVNYVDQLNDSVNSKSKIRESQVISSNEQIRQLDLAEKKREAKKERFKQLQMLLIAIFIPGFFLLTILLSRVRIHTRVIRLLGVLSLLFLFEYLTLLLHPTVANLTYHTPIYEILVFVAIAAVLIPAHHKLEHWMIQRLIHHRQHPVPTKEAPVKKMKRTRK
jgi:tetratricopeptide (TPR) repeat protein